MNPWWTSFHLMDKISLSLSLNIKILQLMKSKGFFNMKALLHAIGSFNIKSANLYSIKIAKRHVNDPFQKKMMANTTKKMATIKNQNQNKNIDPKQWKENPYSKYENSWWIIGLKIPMRTSNKNKSQLLSSSDLCHLHIKSNIVK